MVPRSVQHGLRRSISGMLANAAKYAEPGTPVDIDLALTADEVALRVVNTSSSTGQIHGPERIGLGLNNLQEQAECFNGTFHAELRQHRWVSELRVPLQPHAAEAVRNLSTWPAEQMS
ncbi:hypothetical protein [Austwickia sp. TVS 96-490-7B]|uniref:hypothetical protein n=1 Tax=Austwickia sp. TVS 96-490-7B TaxID=2830843 RepID=UPI001C5689DA|nr:hypothetical protein [Austwickia sp. TVS 96-490-7B]